MLNRKFLVAWLGLFVAWMIGSFLVHGTLLHDDYARLSNLFRPEEEAGKFFPLMILAHVLLSGAFAWIYLRGREERPWLGQGARYGIVMALLTIVPTYTIYYVVQPMPGATVIKQIIFDGLLVVVLGIVAAWLLRSAPRG